MIISLICMENEPVVETRFYLSDFLEDSFLNSGTRQLEMTFWAIFVYIGDIPSIVYLYLFI